MKELNVTDFVNSEHKDFSVVNSRRNIPMLIDGLKPSQRKALYGAFVYNKLELVDRLGLQTAAITAYDKAGDNMSGTISNMARCFPGSNNIPYFDRDGQFGNIISPNPSSPRYISVEISPIIRAIIKKEDEGLVEHLYDRDDKIEPKFFLPIVPMILINGATGIGTGYASSIPNHSVSSVIACLRSLLAGGDPTPLLPYWNGFKGETGYNKNGQAYSKGIFKRVNTSTLHISEVPVGQFSETYKDNVLLPLYTNKVINDYSNDTTEDTWDITVTFPRGELAKMSDEQIIKMFKLEYAEKPTLVAWNTRGSIQQYASVEDMIVEFFNERLGWYEKRRQMMIAEKLMDIFMLNQRIKFIEYMVAADLNAKLSDLKAGFVKFVGITNDETVNDLFKTPVSSITTDGKAILESRLLKVERELAGLRKESDVSLYTTDLNILEDLLK